VKESEHRARSRGTSVAEEDKDWTLVDKDWLMENRGWTMLDDLWVRPNQQVKYRW